MHPLDPYTVAWNIQALITQSQTSTEPLTEEALRWGARLTYMTLHRVIDGTARLAQLDTLARIASVVGCDPPALWAWDRSGSEPTLIWQVQALATARGLSKNQLATRAGITYAARASSVPAPMEGIWNGTADRVRFDTIARLCWALDCDIGPLFRWVPGPPPERPQIPPSADPASPPTNASESPL